MIDKLFIAFFALLPWGHLFFKKMDIWHGQGHFFQIGLLILFCYSFFEKPKYQQPINKSLGLFLLWSGLTTAYHWFDISLKTQNYPLKLFLPFFNLLCVIILYKLCVEYLNKNVIEKILKYLSYSIIAILFYCVLQFFQLDEFFKALAENKDEFVGTLGNTSHISGYLALCQPLFFEKKLRNILALILLWLVILITGSASGLFCASAVLLFYLMLKRKWLFTGILGCISLVGLSIIVLKYLNFFTFSHRLEVWGTAFNELRLKAICGYGLGFWAAMKYQLGGHWRHAHNEYLQTIFETGIIGLTFILWIIWDYFDIFKRIKSDLTIRLASIFFGFCVLALFTFNAHLWVMAGIGILSYSFLYALKSEVQIENSVGNPNPCIN